MKNSNTSGKIKKNLIWGIASELLTIILGILVPRLVLTNYGSEVNGLLGSVTQVYSYVALLEAGVGVVTVQALYKAFATNEKEKVNAVLSATNKYYHRTGVLYLAAIVVFSIVYPLVIRTEIPTLTVVLVIVFNGLGSVINYFFQAKYLLLLQAEGKNYIRNTLSMCMSVFKNAAKIILIRLGFGVVFVQAIAMCTSIIQMVFIAWYVNKYYKWIDLSVAPDFDSISQSKNAFVHQISGLVFNQTDNITLSVFCGLKVVSVYSMYNLFYAMVNTAQVTVSGSVIFLLGQSFHSDKKKFMNLYEVYELYYIAASFSLYAIMTYMILPFLRLYTSGVEDISYINKYLPYLFSTIGLMSCVRNAPNNVINFAGHYKQTQNRSIIEAIINLTVSIIAVQYIGIYGVLIGTIAAMVYRSNDIIMYANRRLIQRSPWLTYRRILFCTCLFIVIQLLNQCVEYSFSSYIGIVLFAIPYSVLVVLAFIGGASIFDIKTAKYAFGFIKHRIH